MIKWSRLSKKGGKTGNGKGGLVPYMPDIFVLDVLDVSTLKRESDIVKAVYYNAVRQLDAPAVMLAWRKQDEKVFYAAFNSMSFSSETNSACPILPERFEPNTIYEHTGGRTAFVVTGEDCEITDYGVHDNNEYMEYVSGYDPSAFRRQPVDALVPYISPNLIAGERRNKQLCAGLVCLSVFNLVLFLAYAGLGLYNAGRQEPRIGKEIDALLNKVKAYAVSRVPYDHLSDINRIADAALRNGGTVRFIKNEPALQGPAFEIAFPTGAQAFEAQKLLSGTVRPERNVYVLTLSGASRAGGK